MVLGDLLCLFLRFQHYFDCNMDKKMLKNSDSGTFNSMNDQLGKHFFAMQAIAVNSLVCYWMHSCWCIYIRLATKHRYLHPRSQVETNKMHIWHLRHSLEGNTCVPMFCAVTLMCRQPSFQSGLWHFLISTPPTPLPVVSCLHSHCLNKMAKSPNVTMLCYNQGLTLTFLLTSHCGLWFSKVTNQSAFFWPQFCCWKITSWLWLVFLMLC